MKVFGLIILLLPVIGYSQIEGDWYTNFQILGQNMSFKLEVYTSPDYVLLADESETFPVQELKDVTLTDSVFKFEWPAIGLTYDGIYSKTDSIIDGTMKQNGVSWQATFHRTKPEPKEVIRPQKPVGPFEYSSDSLIIPNDDIQLGATLTLPKDFNENTKIVVLASGSGAQNRNCEIMGHEPFWVIADHLAKNNIGCLRFDDRGTGTSTGAYIAATIEDLGSDVEACVKYLRKVKKFKKNPIGVAGHSEGGMHTLIAANRYKKIDFVIQLATVGTSGREVLIEQQYLIPKSTGLSEEDALWNQSLFEGMVTIIEKNDQKESVALLADFIGEHYDNAPESTKTSSTRAQYIYSMATFINNPWARSFVAFQTANYLKKLEVPLLAIHGEADIQVPFESNSNGFEHYPQASLHKLPELNHLFQKCDSCTVMEYGDIEQTIDQQVLDILVNWINQL